MIISVIIPYLNDYDVLKITLPILLDAIDGQKIEIIIIDNGSHEKLIVPGYPNLHVIRVHKNVGVGAAFNLGVFYAKSDRLVLMGPDVIPQEGWVDRVLMTLDHSPKTIFSCTSTDWSPDERPFRSSAQRRYGASILYKMNRLDLPEDHQDRIFPNFHRILQAKWNEIRPQGEIEAVECMLGAFYWMHKNDFHNLHGWNGHSGWGSLEPFLSIKARAHGMQIMVDKKLEAAHFFGRKVVRGSRADLQYYNMLFMAHTMFYESLRDELVEYLLQGDTGRDLGRLNVKQGLKMLKRHDGLVQAERNYNNGHFKNGLIHNWELFKKTEI